MHSAVGNQHCHLGINYHRLGDHQSAQKHLDQALVLTRVLDDRVYLPQILLASAELALSIKEYAAAQAYCEECLQLLSNSSSQQHYFRQREVVLGIKILLAKLTYIRGDAAQAIDQLETMLSATESHVEQAALNYTRWQLDQDPVSRRQALTLYRQLYAQAPYFSYRQRIGALTAC
jgi:tetratricopeptide (TPR) repeat protein